MAGLRVGDSIALAGVEDGYIAFNLATGQLTRLNATAALLVELCDGSRGRDEVLAMVRPLVGADGVPGCAAWLESAVASGLVTTDRPSGGGPSAEELDRRADSLREEGRVLAAFAVQARAAELGPGEPGRLAALGELAHIVGRRDAARGAYEAYLALRPDDAEVAHILVALRDGAPPPRAPDRCVEQLYERFAASYDRSMRGDLAYRAPERLERAIGAELGDRRDLDVLDLGCGTGLAGRLLRRRARRLVGIDLSAAMLERARRRRLYDVLEAAEMTEWLARGDGPRFDLIVSCDALIYFGDLAAVLVPAARRLRRGGVVAFTVERSEGEPFRLTDSGRYEHGAGHIAAAAGAAGLVVARLESDVLRYEYGEPVVGLVAVLRAGNLA